MAFCFPVTDLFLTKLFFFSFQDVGPAAGTGDEGYFVPPTKGTSQSQVNVESMFTSTTHYVVTVIP